MKNGLPAIYQAPQSDCVDLNLELQIMSGGTNGDGKTEGDLSDPESGGGD